MNFLQGWPPEAVLSVITMTGAALVWPVKTFLHIYLSNERSSERSEADRYKQGWTLAEARDKEIVALRGVVDRGRRRESAYATGCELLLIAMPRSPTPEQKAIIGRARLLFETALVHSDGRGAGG